MVVSIYTGEIRAYDLMRMIQRDGNPTPLGEAIAHYGRIFKTLHILIMWNLFCQAASIDRGQLGAGSSSRTTLLRTGSKPRTGSWLPPSEVISTGLPSSLPIARRKPQSVSTPS